MLHEVWEERVEPRRKTAVTIISKIAERKARADACLVVVFGDNIGHRFILKPGEYIVGRSNQANIFIEQESISRRHAKVSLVGSRAVISDLGSTNGTYVNNEHVQSRELASGDLVKIGRTVLRYLASDNIEAAYYEEMNRLTMMDGLTGCYNRRYLRDCLGRELSRAARYRRPLSLVVVSIENISTISDEYGHLASDAALGQIARALGGTVRREDVLTWIGDAEFAIVAPEADATAIHNFAMRILNALQAKTYIFDDIQLPIRLKAACASITDVDVDVAQVVPSLRRHIPVLPEGSEPSSSGEIWGAVADNILQVAVQRLQNSPMVCNDDTVRADNGPLLDDAGLDVK